MGNVLYARDPWQIEYLNPKHIVLCSNWGREIDPIDSIVLGKDRYVLVNEMTDYDGRESEENGIKRKVFAELEMK